MPELPEVETLRRGLAKGAVGRRIVQIDVAIAKVLKGQPESIFAERLVGRTITDANRRGKYLILPISTGDEAAYCNDAEPPESSNAVRPPSSVSLCIHLKMRGQLLLEAAGTPFGKYYCVGLGLSDGFELRYHDMWTWGEIRALRQDEIDSLPGLAGMGPEPLEPDWNETVLQRALVGKRTAIKSTLLDQRIVAGIGNIYADEALFLAKIDPKRPAGELTGAETGRLAQSIRETLLAAVDGGGTMSDDYMDTAGVAGRYQPRVYDRGGQACPTCGGVLSRIRLGGRGTFFCGSCQS